MKELKTRTISAIIFATIMIGGILWNQWSFLLLVLLINGFTLFEFYRLFEKHKKNIISKITVIIFSTAMLLSVSLAVFNVFLKAYLFFIPLVIFLWAIELIREKKLFSSNQKITFFGLLYISVPMSLFLLVAIIDGNYATIFLLSALIFTWVNDSFAYFTGSLIGKHKFVPSISPKKTWEGIIGGVVFTVISSLIFYKIYPELGINNWLIISLIISVSSIVGDLFESKLKRKLEVKDSGNIMPGHGGFLDRFDALLFVIPFYTIYLLIFVF